MNGELALLDASGQAELVRAGQVTAVEATEAAIKRIEALNPVLNAVVTPVFDQALDAARSADRAAGSRGWPGPFPGVPYLLKDLACEMKGVRFTEGSRFLAGHVSAFDSELVVRLRAAGLVILGKTSTPEFGMAPACEPELFGPTRNPWDTALSTSGSSGGSAAAVASGMVPFAHGNDLGGSLRYPASACGLFALKPTRARNPLGPEYGDVAAGSAAEHALTRSVRDSAALLDATSGPDTGDPYWAPPPARPFAAEVGADPGRLRIAVTTRTPDGDHGHPDCVAAAEHAARLCESLGHEVTDVGDAPAGGWPGFTEATGAAITTMITSAAAWIMRYWIRRVGREPGPDEVEPLTRALWKAGERVTAADWLTAVEQAQRMARAVGRFLAPAPAQGFDVLLTPTMSAPPLPIGVMTSPPDDPWRSLRVSAQTVRYAGVVANLTGNPAMSVPLHWNARGLPVGVHFLGRFGDEATLLRLAAQLESAQPWAGHLPAVHATGAGKKVG
jgi:amidase